MDNITIDKQHIMLQGDIPLAYNATVQRIEVVKEGMLLDGTPYKRYQGVYIAKSGKEYTVKTHTYHDKAPFLWWVSSLQNVEGGNNA